MAKALNGPSPQDKDQALKLTPVSRETQQRLEAYVALLLQWQATTNLVSPSTLPQLWTRHIADSLQVLATYPFTDQVLNGVKGDYLNVYLDLTATPGTRPATGTATGERVVTVTGDLDANLGEAKVWEWSATAPAVDLKDQAGHAHLEAITHAAFSADGSLLITASNDDTARIWNVKSGALRREEI